MINFLFTLAYHASRELYVTLLAPYDILIVLFKLIGPTCQRLGLRNYLMLVWSLPLMVTLVTRLGLSTGYTSTVSQFQTGMLSAHCPTAYVYTHKPKHVGRRTESRCVTKWIAIST